MKKISNEIAFEEETFDFTFGSPHSTAQEEIDPEQGTEMIEIDDAFDTKEME